MDDLAEKFGGRGNLAQAAGVSVNQVGNWKADGSIPSRRIERILENAGSYGASITLADCFPNQGEAAA